MRKFVLNYTDWDICKAWLDKHSKYQIAVFVGLLPVAFPIVEKRLNIPEHKFKEFMASVTKVEGPIMPFKQLGHPQMLLLISATQNKMRTLCFKDESDYTQNNEVKTKQT